MAYHLSVSAILSWFNVLPLMMFSHSLLTSLAHFPDAHFSVLHTIHAQANKPVRHKMPDSDKRTLATWHLWSLDPVVVELQLCPAAHAVKIAELMIPRHIGFLDSNTGSVARKFQGLYDAAAPTLKHSERALQLNARLLKLLLQKKPSLKDDAQFHPPLIGSEDTGKASQDLIDNLENCHYQKHASTLTFRPSTINPHIKPYIETCLLNSTLPHEPVTTISIMHCGALLSLETAAPTSTSEIHLLSGMRIYLSYPPLAHNIALLQAYFQELDKGLIPNAAKVCASMRDGIAILQQPGQIVTIPPYCPTLVFAPKTNAALMLRAQHKADLPSRLYYVDLLVCQVGASQRVLGHPEAVDGAVEYKIKQLYADLSVFLGAKGEEDMVDGVSMAAMGRAWKKGGVCFREMVERYVCEGVREDFLNSVPGLWTKAVRLRGLTKCPVCEKGTRDIGSTFMEHFWREHWGGNEGEGEKGTD